MGGCVPRYVLFLIFFFLCIAGLVFAIVRIERWRWLTGYLLHRRRVPGTAHFPRRDGEEAEDELLMGHSLCIGLLFP